jgi:glycosyltransferase involved in cell wall biosynthesis
VRRVIIIKTLVKQYRLVFFQKLFEELRLEGVALTVLYGSPSQAEKKKSDNVNLPAEIGHAIPSKYLWGDRLLLQWPSLENIVTADLIIVVNANRNLINFPLMLLSRLGLKRVAFWGHGANHQRIGNSFSEAIKRFLVVQPDWWFAYTEQTAAYLAAVGFDASRITTINNAIDTSDFAREVGAMSIDEIILMRKKLGLRETDRVGLYCGSLYPEKRLPFLLKAAELVAKEAPNFRLLIIGSGVEEKWVREACDRHDFLRYAGSLFGTDKAICYRMAEMVVNPGLVGLAVLDSFAAAVPLLTMADSLHSPEFSYVESGVNGLVVEGNESDFAKAVLSILEDAELALHLRIGAAKSAKLYSVEKMVEHTKEGVLRCLKSLVSQR